MSKPRQPPRRATTIPAGASCSPPAIDWLRFRPRSGRSNSRSNTLVAPVG